jgi:hypothetical protein
MFVRPLGQTLGGAFRRVRGYRGCNHLPSSRPRQGCATSWRALPVRRANRDGFVGPIRRYAKRAARTSPERDISRRRISAATGRRCPIVLGSLARMHYGTAQAPVPHATRTLTHATTHASRHVGTSVLSSAPLEAFLVRRSPSRPRPWEGCMEM